MGKKLHVGNLGSSVGDSALNELFAPHGTVESAKVIMDRITGQTKGFGFVEMSSDAEAQTAIAMVDGKDCAGQNVTVAEARPRPEGGRGGR